MFLLWLPYGVINYNNTQNDRHQWLSDSSRVHQIRPGPRLGSLQRSPDFLAGLNGPYFGREVEMEEQGKGGQRREGRD